MARVTIYDDEIRGRPLPAACVRCGESATTWFRKQFEGLPLWTFLILPVALVLLAISSKKWTLDLPVCDRHPNPWHDLDRFQRIFSWVFFGGLVAMMVLVVAAGNLVGKENEWLIGLFGFFVGSWLVAVFGLIVAYCAFAFLSIRASWLTSTSITLIHVHRRFADAIERMHRGEEPVDVDEDPGISESPADERIRR